MVRDKVGEDGQDEGGDIEERKRVLRHASSLNRADVIKKVVRRSPQVQVASESQRVRLLYVKLLYCYERAWSRTALST